VNLYSASTDSDTSQLLGQIFNLDLFLPAVGFFVLAAVFNPKGPTGASQLIVSTVCGSIAGVLTMQFFRAAPLDTALVGLIILTAGLFWLAGASERVRGRAIYLIIAFFFLVIVIGISVANPDTLVAKSVINGWNALLIMYDAALSWLNGRF
jgi:uncharacterized membrane protein YccC